MLVMQVQEKGKKKKKQKKNNNGNSKAVMKRCVCVLSCTMGDEKSTGSTGFVVVVVVVGVLYFVYTKDFKKQMGCNGEARRNGYVNLALCVPQIIELCISCCLFVYRYCTCTTFLVMMM